jgi:hypothetical protein
MSEFLQPWLLVDNVRPGSLDIWLYISVLGYIYGRIQAGVLNLYAA